MGIWSGVEELSAALEEHLAAEIETVATKRGKGLDTSFTLFKRERAATFMQRVTGVGVGVWFESAQTGAKNQGRRDWTLFANVDYGVRGSSRNAVAEQVELACEAIMRVVDRLATTGSILEAGAAGEGTRVIQDVSEQVQGAAGVSDASPLIAAARIRIPIVQRDEL